MAHLLEFVGSVHIYLGPYRGNDVVGSGETPNKAAADFEDKWKTKGLSADMYSGPSWEGGIKPEKPAPPKPPAAPKPTVPAAASATVAQPIVPVASPAAPADGAPASAPAPALTAQPADKSS
jgi:hypothetical protein